MPISVNNKEITAINFKGKEIVRVHAGLDLVWQKNTGYGDAFVFKIVITTAKNFYLRHLSVGGVVDFNVDWGDGAENSYTSYASYRAHYYNTAGTYIVSISGSCPHVYFATSNSYDVVELLNWGNVGSLSLQRIFQYCKGLEYILDEAIPNVSTIEDFSFMFQFSGLKAIPTSLLDNAIAMTTANSMFYYTQTGLTIPDGLLSNAVNLQNAYAMFAYANVSEVPVNLFANCAQLSNIQWCFGYNANLLYVDADLFRHNPLITSCRFTFQYCGLQSIPDLFDPADHPNLSDFVYAFRYNSSAIGNAPAWWLKWPLLSSTYTNDCFRDCLLLDNYTSIPSAWK